MIYSENGRINRNFNIVNISEHTGFEFSFTFYKFGDWNNEDFIFSLNNKIIIKQSLNLTYKNICANETKGEIIFMAGKVKIIGITNK